VVAEHKRTSLALFSPSPLGPRPLSPLAGSRSTTRSRVVERRQRPRSRSLPRSTGREWLRRYFR